MTCRMNAFSSFFFFFSFQLFSEQTWQKNTKKIPNICIPKYRPKGSRGPIIQFQRNPRKKQHFNSINLQILNNNIRIGRKKGLAIKLRWVAQVLSSIIFT